MKTDFKFALISIALCLFALFFMTSCQNEVLEETTNSEETFVPNSTVANLVRATAANDGSQDDLMDGADCISINLPVTIIANGITVTIETLEDLALLEEIFDEFQNDDDILEFLFPITIILNDYNDVFIENADQLQDFIDECVNQDDDVIECVDFVYPISFSVFNSDFQIIDTVVIDSDEELYNFLDELEDSQNGAIIASLNFPVSLVYADGNVVEVHSNQELANAINAAEEECDDIPDVCDEEEVAMYLVECYWKVVAFNGDDNLVHYQLYFGADGQLTIIQEGDIAYSGSWSLDQTDTGLILFIETDLEDLNGAWNVVDCEEDRMELVHETDGLNSEVVIERICENDVPCSAQEMSYNLQECVWYSANSLYQNVAAEVFNFQENGVVEVYNVPSGQLTATGFWAVSLTDEGVFLSLEFDQEPYHLISLVWEVIECDDDRYKFINGDHYIIFEQDCSDTYDCPDYQANVGDPCENPNGVSGILDENCDCVTDNTYDCPDQQANFGDDCETANGSIGFINENCECQENDTQFDCPDQQANFGDDCETANGSIGFINENCECQEEDTNPFECFGNYALAVCDDDVIDGIASFDLNLIFANCPEDNVEYSFYISLADAENQVNPLSSPYTNVTNPQTIYSRVSLAGNPNVFEIYEHQLIVENCNEPNCTELDVDAYLMSCAWVAVSVNGSNDYQNYWMNFGDGDVLLIEGNGMNLNGSWSTSEGPNGVVVTFSNLNNQFQFLIGDWVVVECTENQIILLNDNSQVVLERDCN
ncbi:MAG: hypothetical protein KJO77_05645 [Bacteroidia bacterium]|nr:hypothetical protein [Bacteroidia bacterium]